MICGVETRSCGRAEDFFFATFPVADERHRVTMVRPKKPKYMRDKRYDGHYLDALRGRAQRLKPRMRRMDCSSRYSVTI